MSSKSNYLQLKFLEDFDKHCPDVDLYLTYDKYQKNLLQKKKTTENFISLSSAVRYPWSDCRNQENCQYDGVS